LVCKCQWWHSFVHRRYAQPFSYAHPPLIATVTRHPGAADARGRIGQLKGTGLVLEGVNVPLPSPPSRIVLQQQGGAGQQDVPFAYKAGVVEVRSAAMLQTHCGAEMPPPQRQAYNIFALVEHSFTLTFHM
jgi:hypothetical protein